MPNNQSNIFVAKFEQSFLQRLKTVLEESNWDVHDAPYCIFQAQKEHTTVSAYCSGKLVAQGRGKEDFIDFVLEPLAGGLIENRSVPVADMLEFKKPHAGVDESGKGDFFGPLVVSCVFVKNREIADELMKLGVCDSKMISDDHKIDLLAGKIKQIVERKYSVVVISPPTYNRLYPQMRSIGTMLAWAHARSIRNVVDLAPECNYAVSDQFTPKNTISKFLAQNGANVGFEQFPKGERDIAVAAASILARNMFVHKMDELSNACGLALPKGATSIVKKPAAEIYLRGGEELLSQYVKMHFKTAMEVIRSCGG